MPQLTRSELAAALLIGLLVVAGAGLAMVGQYPLASALAVLLLGVVGMLALLLIRADRLDRVRWKRLRADLSGVERQIEGLGMMLDDQARVGAQQLTTAREIIQLQVETRQDVAERIEALDTPLRAQREVADGIAAEIARLTAGVDRRFRSAEWQVRHLHADLVNDQQATHQLLSHYAPKVALPPVGGWALSPSALLWLVDIIERRRMSRVVECGSGTSTLWIAVALRQLGAGRVTALEHSVEFAQRTRAMLAAHDLSAWADVRECPLVDTTTPRGTFPWYRLQPDSLDAPIDLLLVDGPPTATGPVARYPALPVLAPSLAPDAWIVVDDADRPDERQAVEWWTEAYCQLSHQPAPARGVEALHWSSTAP